MQQNMKSTQRTRCLLAVGLMMTNDNVAIQPTYEFHTARFDVENGNGNGRVNHQIVCLKFFDFIDDVIDRAMRLSIRFNSNKPAAISKKAIIMQALLEVFLTFRNVSLSTL